jgi:hypothetical protein
LGRGGSGASSGGTHGQTGDEAIGIIAEQLLPPGSRDERLSRARATSTLGAAPRGTAGVALKEVEAGHRRVRAYALA